jgi:hypothetical protein
MARRTQSIEIAKVLERFGFTPEQLETVEDYVWAMAGTIAGYDETPDDAVRRSVLTVMRSRRAHPDPFHGFPRHDDDDLNAIDRIARNEDMATMAGEWDS